MSTDLALWLMATAIGTVAVSFVALIWLGLRWCVAEWARHSRNVDAILTDEWSHR